MNTASKQKKIKEEQNRMGKEGRSFHQWREKEGRSNLFSDQSCASVSKGRKKKVELQAGVGQNRKREKKEPPNKA